MTGVMIVEDTEFMKTVIRDILIKYGYELVSETVDREGAIQKYRQIKPDVVS